MTTAQDFFHLYNEVRTAERTNMTTENIPVIIARRPTADGKRVCLWSDGELTWALGYAIKGSARPRTETQRQLALRAGWLVLGECEIYEGHEISNLVRAARWAAARDGSPGTMRQRMYRPAPAKPIWTILSADRNGRPTCRVWRRPDGTAIWHERGVYEYMHPVSGSQGEVFRGSGIKGPTLRGVLTVIDPGIPRQLWSSRSGSDRR